jgi:hypothetical protein
LSLPLPSRLPLRLLLLLSLLPLLLLFFLPLPCFFVLFPFLPDRAASQVPPSPPLPLLSLLLAKRPRSLAARGGSRIWSERATVRRMGGKRTLTKLSSLLIPLHLPPPLSPAHLLLSLPPAYLRLSLLSAFLQLLPVPSSCSRFRRRLRFFEAFLRRSSGSVSLSSELDSSSYRCREQGGKGKSEERSKEARRGWRMQDTRGEEYEAGNKADLNPS